MERKAHWTSDRLEEQGGTAESRPRLLLLCDYQPENAATIIDHIQGIRRWSRYDVFVMPMFGDIPGELDLSAFDGLAIHYNLIMANSGYLSPLARWRISRFGGVKAAFIQDEHRFVDDTVSAMRTLGIQVLFTCVPEDQIRLVYPTAALPELRRFVTVLTGYVPESLLSVPVASYEDRTVDVGYRARHLPTWLGTLAQEKWIIADRFAADASAYGLSPDISCREDDRLYGQAWVDFIGRSRAMLGVESGASVVDFDGSIERAVRDYEKAHPSATFAEIHRLFLADVDGRIRLNQISPRCFEAAALGALMVLYPGEYSGILEPWRHYVPLAKDHSNTAEVVGAIRDRDTWARITAVARQEVALDPRNSYRGLAAIVDEALDLRVGDRRDVDVRAFGELADRSFARLQQVRLEAKGMRAALGRVRQLALLPARLVMPNSKAIRHVPGRETEKLHGLRQRVRQGRAIWYWALRPRVLPWSALARYRTPIVEEIDQIQILEEMARRAIAAGAASPFAILVDRASGEAKVVLHSDAESAPSVRTATLDAVGRARAISLDLTDPWLVPVGVGGHQTRELRGLSALLRDRPAVALLLLAGHTRWLDVFERS